MEPIQEIKGLVSEMGTSFEEFKAAHGTLQEEVKRLNTEDVVLKERVQKIAEDVAAKYEAAQKQLDAVKSKADRPQYGNGTKDAEQKFADDAALFTKSVFAINKREMPDDIQPDLDAFKAYGDVFPRYIRKGDRSFSQDQMKYLSVGSDPDGGFLVRPEYSTRVIDRVYESSPLRKLASVQKISTSELRIPVDQDEAGAGWVGETQSRPETSTPRVGEKSIVAHEMYANPKATQQLLEDAFIDVEKWLEKKIADKFARLEATAFMVGTGVGQPRGILTYANGTTYGTVEQINSGTNGAFTYSAMLALMTSLKEPYHRNASWLVRRQSVASLMLMVDGDGRYIFQPILMGNFNDTPMLGYNMRYATDMPAIATNAFAMAFGDWAEAYQIVDRIGISTLRDPYTAKPFVHFYTRRRVGGDVVDFDAFKILKLAA